MNDEEVARSEAMAEAISGVLQDHATHVSDEGLVLDFAMVVECVGSDGEPYLRLIHAVNSTQWRRLGLLDYGLTVQKGIIAHDDE